MADKNAAVVFLSLDDISADTGIVFGFEGQPFLSVAIDRARGAAEQPRAVRVISAVSLASVKSFADRVVGAAKVDSTDALNNLITTLTGSDTEALVFHGLDAYAQIVLSGICGTSTPTQAEWGDMARIVANDLRRLTAVSPVLYVTCAAVLGEDDGKARLSINPGLAKFILGDLSAKIFVTTRVQDGEIQTVVQDNPALALDFKAPRVERAAGEATERKPLGGLGGKPERRLR